MAKGLMSEAMAVEDAAPEQGASPASPGGKLLAAAMRVVEQPQVLDAIVAASQDADPAQALSKIAESIVNALDEKAGGQIPPDEMSRFALRLVNLLASLAAAGMDDDEQSKGLGPRTMQSLLQRAVQQAQQPPQGGQGQQQPAPMMQGEA